MVGDFADTRDQDEVILAIDAARWRRRGVLSDQMRRVMADLVLGIPVHGEEMDRCGVTAIGLVPAPDDEEAGRQGSLFN